MTVRSCCHLLSQVEQLRSLQRQLPDALLQLSGCEWNLRGSSFCQAIRQVICSEWKLRGSYCQMLLQVSGSE